MALGGGASAGGLAALRLEAAFCKFDRRWVFLILLSMFLSNASKKQWCKEEEEEAVAN